MKHLSQYTSRLSKYMNTEDKRRLGYIKDWVGYIVLYGVPMAYTASVFFPGRFALDFPHVIAFGFTFHVIKNELPGVVAKLRGPR